MAEVIGLVASVAQLVHLSGTLLAGGYGFLSTVTRAPFEIRSLLTEAAAVNSLLGQLQLIAESTSEPSTNNAVQALKCLGVFDECRATLEFIRNALARCQQEAGKDVQNLGRRLKWPFKEKDTKDALQRLHRLRSVLANAVEVDSANTLRRIETGQGLLVEGVRALSTTVQTRTSQEETQKVMSWLCPLATDGAHISLENALSRRLIGTGEWLLKSSTFEQWIATKHSSTQSSIWITGLPGSGKTLLCASTIQSVLALKRKNVAVLYFFCDHRDPSKLTHDSFVMTLTRQMLSHSPDLIEQAKALYDEKANNGDRAYNRADYIPLIESFMIRFEHVFIFCDALDEAPEGNEIASTLSRLLALGQQHSVPTNVLFTSRFDVQLERRHADITANRVALAENMKPDIEKYVSMEVEARIAKGLLKLRDKALQALVQDRVASRAGTILHARLQLDYLHNAKNDRDLKNMINSLPDGLEHTYKTLLNHIASQHPEQVKEMRLLLQCLVIAAPTLTAANLAEVMAMQPGQRYLDFDSVATDPYDALDIISPFVILTSSKKYHSVVKLSHYSLDEYLLSSRILEDKASQFHVNYHEGNAWLASICLQYLTFDIFNASRHKMARSESPSLDEYTFRRYATLHWFRHYAAAKSVPSLHEQCKPYLSRLFTDDEPTPCYRRWQELYCQHYPHDELHTYSPLSFAISQGLDAVVHAMLPRIANVNLRLTDHYTCLTIAAKWNQPVIIRTLLALGANLEAPATRAGTALHLAAEFASRDAFDVLLDAGADVHARSASGSTPLYRACRGGDVYIVTRLKEGGSDINARTHDSWTPAMEAVENGHEDVVDLLIAWGADLSVKTDQGWTVLSIARNGFGLEPNWGVVEKLKRAGNGGEGKRLAGGEEEFMLRPFGHGAAGS